MMEWLSRFNILVATFSALAGHYSPSLFNGLVGLKNELQGDIEEFNRVQLVIIENQMNKTVYVQWGKTRDDSVGYGVPIPVPPKTAIGRKIVSRNSRFLSDRHSVRVWKEQNQRGENVVSLLWEPNDRCLTKVFIIKDTNITEQRNPEVRNWLIGELDLWQDAD